MRFCPASRPSLNPSSPSSKREMSRIEDVLAPPNEEGTRATILKWLKAVGDAVAKDEPLVELETDKVTVEVPAPVSGTLIEALKAVSAEVSPDEVLARLQLAGEAAPAGGTARTAPAQSTSSRGQAAAPSALPTNVTRTGSELLSPLVRRLLQKYSLAPSDINGTGRNGRVTAQDVARHVAQPSLTPAMSSPPSVSASGSTLVPHTPIRRRVADHVVRSLVEAPHITTLFEADLTRVLKHRALHAKNFESRGARLTITAYFISACVRALRAHPEVNATYRPEGMELHSDVNIGIGTALGDNGLIVPVIHRAQELKFIEIAQRLTRSVEAARAGKLSPQDVRGGTFTISNHGVGGSLLAAPIVINQPQVAILGIGKLQRRVVPIAVEGGDALGIRP